MVDEPAEPRRPRPSARRTLTAVLKASVLLVIASATGTFAYRLAFDREETTGPPVATASRPAASAPALPEVPPKAPDLPERARYLFIGGGSVPESTEVSLEQDLLLAQKVLPGPGAALFAGGAGSKSVRELDVERSPTELLARLGEIFQPRPGRGSRYRAARLATRPATAEEVERALTQFLSQEGAPLTLVVAAHGEKGAEAKDNFIALWGDGILTVERLAKIHEQGSRPLRVVSGACFSGGFAELAFAEADAAMGAPEVVRCGLFASTWDREASGCDPNPDRRAQQSYLLHVLLALGKEDRHGKPLSLAALDLNGDGVIGLLDAHTRARIHSRSIDVPTTTSERWLRAVQKRRGDEARGLLPEDAAVVGALSAALELPDEEAARERLSMLEEQLDVLDEQLARAEQELDTAFTALRSVLLSRFPVLDDPYHVGFRRTLSDNRAAISAILDRSPEGKAFERQRRRLAALDERYSARLASEALVLRLVRAYETLALAGGLRAAGGAPFEVYQRLLSCERQAP